MKLVEILAKELSDWPEDAHLAVQDPDRDNTIWYQSEGHEHLRFDDDRWICRSMFDILVSNPSCRASDYKTAMVTESQWQAERDRQNGGEWRRHRGGKCPVSENSVIDVKLDTGDTIKNEVAGDWEWSHQDIHPRIMQYRIISQPQAEEVEVKDTTIGTLSYKVEIDTSSATQAIDELAAKWDKVDGPLRWRDCVNELDAYIEEFTREREALINRLAEEGFALIPAMTAVMGVADVDMGDWRNWEIGDHLEIFDEKEGHEFKMGQIVKVTGFDGSDEGLPVKASSLNDDEWWFVNNLEAKFISRP